MSREDLSKIRKPRLPGDPPSELEVMMARKFSRLLQMILLDMLFVLCPRAVPTNSNGQFFTPAVTSKENEFYKNLIQRHGIIVEQCKMCWKIGRHVTAKCCHEKPICSRCGSDDAHAREVRIRKCCRGRRFSSEFSNDSSFITLE